MGYKEKWYNLILTLSVKGIQNGDREHTHLLHHSSVALNPLKLLVVFMIRNKNGGKANTLYLTLNYEKLLKSIEKILRHILTNSFAIG